MLLMATPVKGTVRAQSYSQLADGADPAKYGSEKETNSLIFRSDPPSSRRLLCRAVGVSTA